MRFFFAAVLTCVFVVSLSGCGDFGKPANRASAGNPVPRKVAPPKKRIPAPADSQARVADRGVGAPTVAKRAYVACKPAFLAANDALSELSGPIFQKVTSNEFPESAMLERANRICAVLFEDPKTEIMCDRLQVSDDGQLAAVTIKLSAHKGLCDQVARFVKVPAGNSTT